MMKALLIAGCALLVLMGVSPGQARAEHNNRYRGGQVYVDVQVGGYGGYYNSGPVICQPPRPVYRPAPVYCPPPVYSPPPVRYCPPPVVYRQPVYQGGYYDRGYQGGCNQSYNSGHYQSYRSSRHCDW